MDGTPEVEPSGGQASQPRQRKFTGSPTTVAGEVLITAGLLVGLLVVWELFWTDVGANRDQTAVVASLDEEWGSIGVPLVLPDQDTEFPRLSADAMRDPADAPSLPQPDHVGQTFATMYVPRWGEKYVKPISEGVSRSQVLDSKGIGRYRRSQMPGQVGNFAVAAHRTTYGKPFSNIDRLKRGDALVVRTEGYWFVYEMVEKEIVEPNDVTVIRRDPFGGNRGEDGRFITLTTCHPKFSALQRYIVHGELKYWAVVTDGYPPELFGSTDAAEAA